MRVNRVNALVRPFSSLFIRVIEKYIGHYFNRSVEYIQSFIEGRQCDRQQCAETRREGMKREAIQRVGLRLLQ